MNYNFKIGDKYRLSDMLLDHNKEAIKRNYTYEILKKAITIKEVKENEISYSLKIYEDPNVEMHIIKEIKFYNGIPEMIKVLSFAQEEMEV